MTGKQGHRKRILALGTSVALVALLTIVGIWGSLSGVFQGAFAGHPGNITTQIVKVSLPVSPLLFGTNMGLFNSLELI